MNKGATILQVARNLATSATNWADFSNALFDAESGLVSREFSTPEDRRSFQRTKEYREIRQLVESVRNRTGLVEGATPEKSGRFNVRLPKSLHAALEEEAVDEAVSLNQLVLAKLAIQLSKLSKGSTPDIALLAQAYIEVRDGFSIDRVVADPLLNRRFLRRCRELGLAGTDFDLNWKLFNGRKAKHFDNLPKTKNYTASRKDEFEFSCEIAIRVVQDKLFAERNELVSLDKIICDPDLAAEFDDIAQRLAPGFKPIDYRWVALGVRKAAGRLSSQARKLALPSFSSIGQVQAIQSNSISTEQGVYVFRCEDEPIFVGETDNLRARIQRHFDVGKGSGVPDWIYDSGSRPISLGILEMPGVSATNRKIAELSAVFAYKPRLNYLNTSAA